MVLRSPKQGMFIHFPSVSIDSGRCKSLNLCHIFWNDVYICDRQLKTTQGSAPVAARFVSTVSSTSIRLRWCDSVLGPTPAPTHGVTEDILNCGKLECRSSVDTEYDLPSIMSLITRPNYSSLWARGIGKSAGPRFDTTHRSFR